MSERQWLRRCHRLHVWHHVGEVLRACGHARRLLLKKASFRGYGSSFSVEFDASIESEVLAAVPPGFEAIDDAAGDSYQVLAASSRDRWDLFRNGQAVVVDQPMTTAAAFFGGAVSWTLARVGDLHCYLHAGAVSIGDAALVLPAKSNHGKTTLTAALLRRGTAYLSDEYALIDDRGLVHPFPRDLRFDTEQGVRTAHPSALGAMVSEPVRPRLIVLVAYDPEGLVSLGPWLSPAEALVALIDHTPSMLGAPEVSLRRLARLAEHSVTIRATRGDADEFAELLLEQLDDLAPLA